MKFSVGDLVHSETFGRGTVINVNGIINSHPIVIKFICGKIETFTETGFWLITDEPIFDIYLIPNIPPEYFR